MQQEQQESNAMQIELPPNPSPDPHLTRPPMPLFIIHRSSGDLLALRKRKQRVFNLQTQDSDLQNSNLWFDWDQVIRKKLKFLKTSNEILNLCYELSQPDIPFHRLLCLIKRCLPSISTFNMDLDHFWMKSKELKRALLKILASFKRPVHFNLLLRDTDKPAVKLKYLQQLRGFQNLALNLTCSSVLLKKSILPSCLGKLRRLRELNITMFYLKHEGDEFVRKLALALSKFSRLKKFHLKIPSTKVCQSSLLMLFQRFPTLKHLIDFSLNFSGCTMIYDNQNNDSFAEYIDGFGIKKFGLTLPKNLEDQNLSDFFQILKKLNRLGTLNFTLHWNETMVNRPFEEFGSILSAQYFLTSLHLEILHVPKGNNILQAIAAALEYLQNLTDFDLKLRNTHSDETQLQQLFLNLRFLKPLESLCIWTGWNVEITDCSLETLGQSLEKLVFLQSLSLKLYSHSATDQGGVTLTSKIKNLNALKHLTLDFFENSNLTDKTLNELTQSLKSLDHLRSVEIFIAECFKMNNTEKLIKTLRGIEDLSKLHLWLPHCEQIIEDLDKEKVVNTWTDHFVWPTENIPQTTWETTTWGNSIDYQTLCSWD